ncbi:MAG: putative transcriptional regulator, Crp/Fnr family [Xanthobacteraceae bacterium]|jgi:voltage-gated potassium channel|nr:putative transcriptional regulator, Crp/Fnr family [Xanthobacteraceae bacterium]
MAARRQNNGRFPGGLFSRGPSDAWWRRQRKRCYEILERDSARDPLAEKINIALIALIVLNVIVAVLETVPSLLLRDYTAFRAFEYVSLIVFAVEYALRVWVSPEDPRYRGLPHRLARRRYMMTPVAIVDLIAWLPFVISMMFGVNLRTLAILRLLRFIKLARYSPGMQSLLEVLEREWQSLVACFWLLAAAVLIAASAMYVAEGSVQPEHLGSIPAAMWWAMSTVTTVGYGDVYPVTAAGRIIAGVTMVTGIVMIALPVGIIATAFVDVIKRRDFVITWGMVARVPLFADLDAAGIGEIHRMLSSHTAQPGEVIARRGDVATSMYFIASGEVTLEFADEMVVLGEGQFFGEMALLHTTRRAATARARTRCMMLMLDAEDLADVIRRHPAIGERVRAMAKDDEGPHALRRRADIAQDEIDNEPTESRSEPTEG